MRDKNKQPLQSRDSPQRASRRDFLKESSKMLGAGLAFSTLGAINPIFAATQAKKQNPNKKGDNMQTITLHNGVKMPILGYGVYQIDKKECQRCVEDALSVGYRSIDTAASYFNEEAVGAAIKASGIKREELFITTKLWITSASESKAKKAFETSLKKLGLEYLDLYLIHQPFNDVYGAWRVMSALYQDKLIRAIGVSNFYPDRLVDFCSYNEIKPALNQVECNPMHAQFEAQKIMQEYNVAMESWAPFGEGRNNMFGNPIIAAIGKKYNKSVAQVILRWLIQRNIIVIPKTTRKERMIENFSVFDFELDSKDMQTMASLDDKKSLFFDHRDPAMVKWLSEYKADI